MLTEPAAAEMAVDHITDDELARLRENLGAMRGCVDDTEAFVRLDTEFHDQIALATRNKVIVMMREPIRLLFMPAGQIILPRLETRDRVIHAHMVILDAIERRDKTTVREWMHRHMADFHRAYAFTGLDIDQPMQMPETALSPQRPE